MLLTPSARYEAIRNLVRPWEVQDLWIRMSGCATIIKLWLTSGLYVSLARLVISMIVTYSTRRMMTNATE